MRGMRGLNAVDPALEDVENNQFLQRRRDLYVYEAAAISLATSATTTDTIQIEADSSFILQKLAYHSTPQTFVAQSATMIAATDATRLIPPVSIVITDTGSGRQLMPSPIPIPSLFGTGQLPFILPNPRLFMRNSTISIQFTNLDNVAIWTVRLAFIGYKVYATS